MSYEAEGHEPYIVPRYRAAGDLDWYHVLHGTVPGHQIDFIYCPEVPQGSLTQTHLAHLARLIKYIEPRQSSPFAFAIGNLSRDDVQHEPGHGGLALMFCVRIHGVRDHASRDKPPFAHGLVAIDRALGYEVLHQAIATFYRRFSRGGDGDATGDFYRSYVRTKRDLPHAVRDLLRAHTDSFDDLPRIGRSTFGHDYLAPEEARAQHVHIVHANDEPFENIAAVAALIGSVLYRSNIKWTSISNGREIDIAGGVAVRFVPEAEMSRTARGTIVRLDEVPRDESELADKLFGARPRKATGETKRLGWREVEAARKGHPAPARAAPRAPDAPAAGSGARGVQGAVAAAPGRPGRSRTSPGLPPPEPAPAASGAPAASVTPGASGALGALGAPRGIGTSGAPVPPGAPHAAPVAPVAPVPAPVPSGAAVPWGASAASPAPQAHGIASAALSESFGHDAAANALSGPRGHDVTFNALSAPIGSGIAGAAGIATGGHGNAGASFNAPIGPVIASAAAIASTLEYEVSMDAERGPDDLAPEDAAFGRGVAPQTAFGHEEAAVVAPSAEHESAAEMPGSVTAAFPLVAKARPPANPSTEAIPFRGAMAPGATMTAAAAITPAAIGMGISAAVPPAVAPPSAMVPTAAVATTAPMGPAGAAPVAMGSAAMEPAGAATAGATPPPAAAMTPGAPITPGAPMAPGAAWPPAEPEAAIAPRHEHEPAGFQRSHTLPMGTSVSQILGQAPPALETPQAEPPGRRAPFAAITTTAPLIRVADLMDDAAKTVAAPMAEAPVADDAAITLAAPLRADQDDEPQPSPPPPPLTATLPMPGNKAVVVPPDQGSTRASRENEPLPTKRPTSQSPPPAAKPISVSPPPAATPIGERSTLAGEPASTSPKAPAARPGASPVVAPSALGAPQANAARPKDASPAPTIQPIRTAPAPASATADASWDEMVPSPGGKRRPLAIGIAIVAMLIGAVALATRGGVEPAASGDSIGSGATAATTNAPPKGSPSESGGAGPSKSGSTNAPKSQNANSTQIGTRASTTNKSSATGGGQATVPEVPAPRPTSEVASAAQVTKKPPKKKRDEDLDEK